MKEIFLQTTVCVAVPTSIRRKNSFELTGLTSPRLFKGFFLRFKGFSFAMTVWKVGTERSSDCIYFMSIWYKFYLSWLFSLRLEDAKNGLIVYSVVLKRCSVVQASDMNLFRRPFRWVLLQPRCSEKEPASVTPQAALIDSQVNLIVMIIKHNFPTFTT